jgi:hypothetical protein
VDASGRASCSVAGDHRQLQRSVRPATRAWTSSLPEKTHPAARISRSSSGEGASSCRKTRIAPCSRSASSTRTSAARSRSPSCDSLTESSGAAAPTAASLHSPTTPTPSRPASCTLNRATPDR